MLIPTERETIEKAKAGDHRAFRTLVESFQGFLYSVAFRFTHDEAEAEDLVQEVFIKLWKNLDRYNPEYKMKTWLGKMITNQCLDFLKSARTRSEKSRTSMDNQLPITDPKRLETNLDATELHTIVLRIAEQLTPKQRAVFILRDLEMLEVNEVCDMLGMTPGNLKNNLYYARLKIKENLLKYYQLQPYEMRSM